MRYLNCGDWVETMSAVLEYGDGRMETVLYKDFMKRLAYGKCGTMEDEMCIRDSEETALQTRREMREIVEKTDPL